VIEQREAQAYKAITATVARLGGAVAAILVEPIQGGVGAHFFRSEFLRGLRQLADEHGFLLVFDETDCGFGATGDWWDYRHHGVVPDLLIFGGRVGLSGVAFGDATLRLPLGPAWGPTGLFGSVADFVALERTLAVFAQEELLANVRAVGNYMLKELVSLSTEHAEVSGVRGRGLVAAFDLPGPELRDRLIGAALDERLLLLPTGTRSVRLRPTLDVTADTVGRAMAQLDAALKRAQGKKA
jgi:L-lysine 6-transaminase